MACEARTEVVLIDAGAFVIGLLLYYCELVSSTFSSKLVITMADGECRRAPDTFAPP